MFEENRRLNFFDRFMVAITFAEADDHKAALDFLNEKPAHTNRKQKRRRVEKRTDDRPALRV